MADRGSEVTPSDFLQLRSWPTGPSWESKTSGLQDFMIVIGENSFVLRNYGGAT